ncbi:MAG TPA: hypothetical protein VK674_06530 [Candidatus Limnocylindria bacterium]|nr:hypothetical protein [Candidatus Limnocylindria bacterium]
MFKTKIKQLVALRRPEPYGAGRRLVALALLIVLLFLGLTGPLYAQTFTQGYGVEGKVQKGMIVRLKEGDTTKVQAVSREQMDKMHGVVVNPNDAAVTLSGEGEKVFVATRGRQEVLVSTENGGLKEGDLITVSALSGVGMKAGAVQPLIIGRATEAFDGSSQVVGTARIKDSSGGEREVRLGRVEAEINIGKNPLLKSEEPNMPEFLRRVSEAVAGKPVDAVRVYLGMVVFFITTIVSGSLLYGGVRSGLISIGRNPLSKKLIIRGMLQVIVAGLIIFILGVFAVYLLLKL